MRSQRLRLGDVRGVYQLLGEVQELGRDLDAWRRHLLEGLCRLTGGQVGLTVDERGFGLGRPPQMLRPVEVGWPDEARRQVRLRYMSVGKLEDDPGFARWLSSVRSRRFVLALREQWVDDATWYGSAHVNEVRRASGVDSWLTCSYGWPALGCFSGVTLNRAWGDQPFTVRELRIVRLFEVELVRVLQEHGVGAAHDGEASEHAQGLSGRLRQTLRYLRQGLSEKEIAAAMSLSRHTVHDYVKGVYRRLGVSSRGELMALRRADSGPDGAMVLPPGWVKD